MKKIHNFLMRNKKIIIFNLIIMTCYVFITCIPDYFGIDDITANRYIFNKDSSFYESIKSILYHYTHWNSRIGELVYYVIGMFPKWICLTIAAFLFITFLNLIFFFIYGIKTKKFIQSKKYYSSMLLNYCITLLLYPAFSETMMWMSGLYSHLLGIIIILLLALPFRFLLDDYNIFEKRKKLKYIYFVCCILAGYTVENLIPWILMYELMIIIYLFIKKKKKYNWCIYSILIIFFSSISFFMLPSTRYRISYFEEIVNKPINKKNLIKRITQLYSPILLIVLILLGKYISKKDKFEKNFKIIIIQFILSLTCIIVMFFNRYFAIRSTILPYFFLLTIITYLYNCYNISNKKLIFRNIFLSIISISATLFLMYFYIDFNKFNKYRKDYILNQNYENKIYCPLYKYRVKYIFIQNLTSWEYLFCDKSYLIYLNENNKNKKVIYNTIVIKDK